MRAKLMGELYSKVVFFSIVHIHKEVIVENGRKAVEHKRMELISFVLPFLLLQHRNWQTVVKLDVTFMLY